MKVYPHLNGNYHFDNFIEGDCSKLSRSAGIAVAKESGGNAFNPLVIYGQVCMGKTHLVLAIGNEALKTNKSKTVLYNSTEFFTNQIIQVQANDY